MFETSNQASRTCSLFFRGKEGEKRRKKKKAHIQFKTFVAYIQLEAFAEANLCSF